MSKTETIYGINGPVIYLAGNTGFKMSEMVYVGKEKLVGEVIDVVDEGNRLVKFEYEGIFEEVLDELGQMPLPPYITHQLKDKNRYQTVYAKYDGSAAAPTAGLHFTKELLQQIKDMGVNIAYVTLHVGLGTFRPVKVDDVLEHHMHSEFYRIEEEDAELINETKKNGGRVISVGTTSTRTLESVAEEDGTLHAKSGWTDIFIYPGYKFKVIDGLITGAAALAAVGICPPVKDYLLASHISAEPAGAMVLKALGLKPAIQAGMCLGEGTGAAALFPLLDMAAVVYDRMSSFEEIHVEQYEHLK